MENENSGLSEQVKALEVEKMALVKEKESNAMIDEIRSSDLQRLETHQQHQSASRAADKDQIVRMNEKVGFLAEGFQTKCNECERLEKELTQTKDTLDLTRNQL